MRTMAEKDNFREDTGTEKETDREGDGEGDNNRDTIKEKETES